MRGAKMLALRVALGAAIAAAATLGLTSCAPCSGVVGCDGESMVRVSGQLVERATGRPVAGTRVDIVPAAGATTFASISGTTDSEGLWRAEGPAPAGDLVVDVVVTPPAPRSAYHVRGLHVRASTQRGEGAVLGRWVVDPFVYLLGEVRNRFGNALVPNAQVDFTRTGGVASTPSKTIALNDEVGRFHLRLVPADVGDVIGDLVVRAPGLTTGTRFANTHIRVEYRDEPVEVGLVLPIGSWLTYTGEIYFRGTKAILANTDVQFRRTGGIQISPTDFTTHIGPSGRFTLAPSPVGEGEVVGELSFTPPGTTSLVTVPNVRLTTYDSLETRLVRVGYGEQFAYAGELQLRGTYTRAPGIPVEFRRTGGITMSPDVLRGTSDANGRFPLIASTTDSGFVVGDLTVDPDGLRRQVYAGVRLRTFASDELRFAQVWPVGDGIFYAGELVRRGTLTHDAGVDVTFVRTGGVDITPATTVGRTDQFGRFLIAASAASSGVVIGDLLARDSSGFTTTIRGVQLKTQRDDSLRLAGVWGYGASLLYAGEVLDVANDRPVVGARVSFERTGGLAATPARVDAVTDANGRFPLHLTPNGSGVVVGTLTIRPPAPWADVPVVINNVQVPTFDGDEQRLLAVWRIPSP